MEGRELMAEMGGRELMAEMEGRELMAVDKFLQRFFLRLMFISLVSKHNL